MAFASWSRIILPYKNLEQAKLPVHIVTTNIVTGETVVLSEGPAAEAIVAKHGDPGRVRTG